MKDHVKREYINDLRFTAQTYGHTQQLRSRLRTVFLKALDEQEASIRLQCITQLKNLADKEGNIRLEDAVKVLLKDN